MEGKKYGALGQNCQAVSEIIGQVLMIGLVVLSFSVIALTVFSDEGAVKPQHTPYTDLRENIDTLNNTVQIVHSGGENIDLKEIKVVFNANGSQAEFNVSSDPCVTVLRQGNPVSKDGLFMLGDCIKINTTGKGVTFTSSDSVDIFFIHTPSRKVIQRSVIQRAPVELPEWITPYPYGSVYDVSGGGIGEWEPTELVGWTNDGVLTECSMVKDKTSNETFDFGMGSYGMNNTNPTKILLKIVYITHDDSQKNMKLEIDVGSGWVQVAGYGTPIPLKMYKDVSDCNQDFAPVNITDKVVTVERLRNLKVRFSADGNANSANKIAWVDFVGIHVEF